MLPGFLMIAFQILEKPEVVECAGVVRVRRPVSVRGDLQRPHQVMACLCKPVPGIFRCIGLLRNAKSPAIKRLSGFVIAYIRADQAEIVVGADGLRMIGAEQLLLYFKGLPQAISGFLKAARLLQKNPIVI